MIDKMDIITEVFKDPHTVVIGSIGLNVATDDSDIDLCVHKDALPIAEREILVALVHQGEYSESLLTQHSALFQMNGLDLFVFDDVRKLMIIQAVMDIMNTYPKVLLRIKWIRVKMFRHLLEKHGFLL